MQTTYTLSDLKPGMQVMFVDPTYNTHPISWVDAPHESNIAAYAGRVALVVAVDAMLPGKVVALAFKNPITCGHSCDGRVPEGCGAYALPSQLYSIDAWRAHKAAHVAAREEQSTIDTLLAVFMATTPPPRV